jgi:hypothetical protein
MVTVQVEEGQSVAWEGNAVEGSRVMIMRYQTGNTRDEPSLVVLDAARNGKEFPFLECLLIFAMCISLVLIPVVGLIVMGS